MVAPLWPGGAAVVRNSGTTFKGRLGVTMYRSTGIARPHQGSDQGRECLRDTVVSALFDGGLWHDLQHFWAYCVHDAGHALTVGVQSVGLQIQAGGVCRIKRIRDCGQKVWLQRHLKFGCERFEVCFKRSLVIRPEIRRPRKTHEQRRQVTVLQLGQNAAQMFAGFLWGNTSEQVIAAQCDDNRVDLGGQCPIDARSPPGTCVAGHAAIDDARTDPTVLQPSLKLRNEPFVLGKPIPRCQTVTQRKNRDRLGLRGKSHEDHCNDPLGKTRQDPISNRNHYIPSKAGCPMTTPILSLTDARLTLGHNAGRTEILKGITLDVSAGETLGLTGPSGSGKSSLLMLMGGLEQATGGSVSALGRDLGVMGEDDLARFRRDHMGVVFQSFHLIPTMTALENVATPLELAGARDAFDRAAEELEAVGLSHRLDHYPSQMSGGEQQRVALARAAAPRPEILLADEPTGNLDGATGATIMDLLFGLRDRHGATLILVTHAPELAERCDRIVHIQDGVLA